MARSRGVSPMRRRLPSRPNVAIRGHSWQPRRKQADVEDEDDKPEGENEQPAAKSKFAHSKFKLPSLKLMIIGGAGLLVLGGGGGGAYFFFKGAGHKSSRSAAVKAGDLRRSARRAGQPVECRRRAHAISQGQDRARTAGRRRWSPQIQPLMPRVMDAFQTYLRELRPTDLDGSAGLYRLKEELTRRVNAAIAPNRVTRRAVQGNRRPVTAHSESRRLRQWRQRPDRPRRARRRMGAGAGIGRRRRSGRRGRGRCRRRRR